MHGAGRRGGDRARSPRRGTLSVARLLGAGSALALTALVVVGSAAYVRIDSLIADQAPVEHTYAVLDRIEALRTLIVTAETGQRGFVLTGRTSYLAPYHRAEAEVLRAAAELRRLTADDPAHQDDLDQLRQPLLAKLSEMKSTVDLRWSEGFDAARRVIVTDRGRRDMAVVTTILTRMEEREAGVLRQRQAKSAQTAAATRAFIVAASGIGVLVVALTTWLLARAVTVPVARVTAAARRVSAGDLSRPAEVSGPVEVADLARAVNASVAAVARARDDAVAADAAKSAFLAAMSHEMRTPLNAVIGMTGFLLDTELRFEQREFAETIRDSGEALLAVINDVLDYSKIQAGDLEIEDRPFDVRECLEGAVGLLALAAGEKGLELVLDVEEACVHVVSGDVTRFRQVVLNLVGNAVKFTQHGEVVVTVKSTSSSPDPDGPVRLEVAVADTGIGIPPDRLDRLFRSFSQVDSSTTRLYGGTGLGLVISRRIAQAMDGDVTVSSTEGTGSVFTLTAVVRRVAEDVRTDGGSAVARADGQGIPGRPNPLQDRWALVVDDNAASRRVLRAHLERWGMRCTEVAEPQQALRAIAARRALDVALVDVQMPGMDGRQLARAVRDTPEGSHLPMILLSGMADPATEEDGALFASTLSKPARSAVLHDHLVRALTGPAGDTGPGDRVAAAGRGGTGRPRPSGADADGPDPVPEAPVPGASGPLRILLAEDNPVNQRVTLLMLRRMGLGADLVENGTDAVRAVLDGDYDVVLMDVHMPGIDGLEATRRIRAARPDGGPYIVALTASALNEDRIACREVGMDGHVAKPTRPQELRAALAVPLRRAPDRPAGTSAGTPAGTPATGPGAGEGADAATRREDGVRARLEELAGPDPGEDVLLFGQILASFVTRAPGLLDAVRQAVERGDPAALRESAHSLKGAASNLGADLLAELSQAAEDRGREGTVEGMSALLPALGEEVVAACAAVASVHRGLVGESSEAGPAAVVAAGPAPW